MSSDSEADMDEFDWLAAAETVENKTWEYHGNDRVDLLAQHHRNILILTRKYDWASARIYDKLTRIGARRPGVAHDGGDS